MTWSWLEDRPVVVCIAGPNGAGKTTFYHTHIKSAGLLLVNADLLARELDVGAYEAAEVANQLRKELVGERASFAFETVFSDPVGDKVQFLKETAASGYTVAVCFIGLKNASMSEQRVAMRVSQGGHDVPTEKLKSRFPRSLINLKSAIVELPHVVVFDNSNLATPYTQVAVFENGRLRKQESKTPAWLRDFL